MIRLNPLSYFLQTSMLSTDTQDSAEKDAANQPVCLGGGSELTM